MSNRGTETSRRDMNFLTSASQWGLFNAGGFEGNNFPKDNVTFGDAMWIVFLRTGKSECKD